MEKIKFSPTFKRIAFTLVTTFFAALIIALLLGLAISKDTANAIGGGVAIGWAVVAFTQFPVWFSKPE